MQLIYTYRGMNKKYHEFRDAEDVKLWGYEEEKP
jgi:hypothetical protein